MMEREHKIKIGDLVQYPNGVWHKVDKIDKYTVGYLIDSINNIYSCCPIIHLKNHKRT